MNRSLETRLAKLEERQPVKDRLVVRVIDDLAGNRTPEGAASGCADHPPRRRPVAEAA
jgi:hypothetical protein